MGTSLSALPSNSGGGGGPSGERVWQLGHSWCEACRRKTQGVEGAGAGAGAGAVRRKRCSAEVEEERTPEP